MAHWFHIEFYNCVSHMATVKTDCSGLCRVTIRKALLLLLSSMFHRSLNVPSPSVFKNQSIKPEWDNTYVVYMHYLWVVSHCVSYAFK